jgi:hypothetical protein
MNTNVASFFYMTQQAKFAAAIGVALLTLVPPRQEPAATA